MNVIKNFQNSVNDIDLRQHQGTVLQSIGLVIDAHCPGVFVGELCEVITKHGDEKILCEVVGFKEDRVLLMPYEKPRGITLGSKVKALGKVASVNVGDEFLGRVVDAFGEPIDDGPAINFQKEVSLYKEPINPLKRKNIQNVFSTGIKAIDSCLTLGKGQRVGVFAGSGVGKSSLLASICKSSVTNQQINIIALIGERGREVEEFISETLGKDGIKNSIVIAATAEQPPLVRAHAVYSAIAMAEHFSEQGKDVFFTLDSMTRFAMALREVGLAIGEPPTIKGYTTSVFSAIPSIVERCGEFKSRGAITAIFTVLVEGDDFNDPIVDTLRAILDGHIVLTRKLAEKFHYPAIDILQSVSRLFNSLSTDSQKRTVAKVRLALSNYEENKELLELGMLDGDQEYINALKSNYKLISSFLQQELNISSSYDSSLSNLLSLGLKEMKVA